MFSLIQTIIAFIIAIGILVTFHEFGHYIVARLCGVKVLKFSVGFGKPLWKWVAGKDRTEYIIARIPLGGYVKMLGEEQEKIPDTEIHRAFNRQSLGKRAAIVSAGPVFNFFLAIFLYWLTFMHGMPGIKSEVSSVEPNSIAAVSGLNSGDRIVSIDGEYTPTWKSARMALISGIVANEDIHLEVEDQQQHRRSLTLNVSGKSLTIDNGEPMELLGIFPVEVDIPPVIEIVESGSAAEKAGIIQGDLIVEMDGEPVDDWMTWVKYVRKRPGKQIGIVIQRESSRLNLVITPDSKESNSQTFGHIGAGVKRPDGIPVELQATLEYSPLEATSAAIVRTWKMTVLTLQMLGKMVAGDISLDNISGPIAIAGYAGQTAAAGFVTYISFLAIISISLGIMNLLPIPMLDGGHLMYYLIEAVKGSPVPEAIQMKMQAVGALALLLMMGFAIFNDIARLF